uniref:Phospholipase putative n=1 Tax=Albugo laibachii Nc14 TaxID=890382 RepID=F0W6D2_9STRA|nr:phospholipase putative [Albugo laibachii Nc14]|eukprot:CCA16676.1 phospholipase putative [Albugo laibachii Nc14]
MYHVAEIVRDAQHDMHERYRKGGTTLSIYTPFPFLYALSGQIVKTMQRKAPDVVKRLIVDTRDQIAEAAVATQNKVYKYRISVVKSGQKTFYLLKKEVENAPIPSAIVPLRTHVALPLLNTMEGVAQFITSDELPEIYFVAKNQMLRHWMLRKLIGPPLGVVEGIMHFAVIGPSLCVFPSREEIESRTDVLLEMSTTQLRAILEYLYSATQVLDHHWSMVQWNILGRGPYVSLSEDRRREVLKSIYQRSQHLQYSRYKLYEFLLSIKLQNELLYMDLLQSHPHLANFALQAEDRSLEPNTDEIPCWFYCKLPLNEIGTELQAEDIDWIEFPSHENRRLERMYRQFQQHNELGVLPSPSRYVVVDEGRFEVCLDTMTMLPVYWNPLETIVVHRAFWMYTKRSAGIAPYYTNASRILENAYLFYLSNYEGDQLQLRRDGMKASQHAKYHLKIPIDNHLVEFKSPNDIFQYKRLLAGTTPFTSKRRVYRGDPRVRLDSELLRKWQAAISMDEKQIREDDTDIEREIDHLVFIIHGIGDALKTIDLMNVVTLRSIVDCASSLRALHREALQSAHFDSKKKQTHVEFLPIEWHSKLHISQLDQSIRDVTLPAIPRLRELANDTILDVLFFMSPVFHQTILEHVANEMNRVYQFFQARRRKSLNSPVRTRKVSIYAHSLGAVISFDLLFHQNRHPIDMEIRNPATKVDRNENLAPFQPDRFDSAIVNRLIRSRSVPSCKLASTKSQVATTNIPVVQLLFSVDHLFCLGSPIGLFLNVRGLRLGSDYQLPTCRRVFNIFHPYDPVAYRLEPIITSSRAQSKATIIRTFEGKLRFQYQIRQTLRTMYQKLREWTRTFEVQVEDIVQNVGLVEEKQLRDFEVCAHSDIKTCDSLHTEGSGAVMVGNVASETNTCRKESSINMYGRLSDGLPIDYCLQENEIEITNEYLFALTAHVIYWTNRDASLFVAQHLMGDDSIYRDEQSVTKSACPTSKYVSLRGGNWRKKERDTFIPAALQVQVHLGVYHIKTHMMGTTQMTSTGSIPTRRKRAHSKGRRKSKSERQVRACTSLGVFDKDGNELSPNDIITIESYKQFLKIASLETSNAWDIAQSIAKRLDDSTARILTVREVLVQQKSVRNNNAKAAAHYAKRLHLTSNEFLQVVLSPVVSGSNDEDMLDETLLIDKPLCIARFILDFGINELLTPKLCFEKIICCWFSHLYGDEKSAVKQNEKITEMESACRLLLNASVELQRCSFAHYLQPAELSNFPILLHGSKTSGIQSQMKRIMQVVREEPTVEAPLTELNQRILQFACQNEARNEQARQEIERGIQSLWSDASVYLFGSAATSLSIDIETADVDLVVILPSQSTVFRKASAHLVIQLKDHLESLVSEKSLFCASKSVNFSLITNARIPITRLWIEYDNRNQQIDICINNIAALWNTKLISHWIGQREERPTTFTNHIYMLSLWIRRWFKKLKQTKNGSISDLSSYSIQLLILFFFHQKYPETVSEIDLHEDYQQQESLFASNPFNVDFEGIHEIICEKDGRSNAFRCSNTNDRQGLLILVMEFFHYYCFEFDWKICVVSLRFRSILTKKAKNWNRSGAKWKVQALSIEDPIEIERDLGALLKCKGQIYLKLHFLGVCYQLSTLSAGKEAQEIVQLMPLWL